MTLRKAALDRAGMTKQEVEMGREWIPLIVWATLISATAVAANIL
jgi:hypothetical protein